jgi:hypothetical protein
MRNTPRATEGFGCPTGIDPHHLSVLVPAGRNEPVEIVEKFGIRSGIDGLPDEIVRSELARPKWTAIADHVKRIFNERLKEKGLSPSKWSPGENKLERLLGKELCVLVWAIEVASEDVVPVALKNWAGLKPEERWWLFTMTAAATGEASDKDVGWRKALRFALTENPVRDAADFRARRKKPVQRDLLPKSLPLFDR